MGWSAEAVTAMCGNFCTEHFEATLKMFCAKMKQLPELLYICFPPPSLTLARCHKSCCKALRSLLFSSDDGQKRPAPRLASH